MLYHSTPGRGHALPRHPAHDAGQPERRQDADRDAPSGRTHKTYNTETL